MEIVKKLENYSLLVSLLYVMMGIIMIMNPKFVCDAVNYIVGSLVILYGVIYMIKFFSKNSFNNLSKFNLLAGLLSIVFGLYILFNPTLLLSIIPFVTGMLVILDGFGKLKNAIDFKSYGYIRWWVGIIFAVLFIGLGAFMLFKSFAVTELVVRIIGGLLILDAISDIWSYFCYRKYSKKIAKSFNETEFKEANVIEYKEK